MSHDRTGERLDPPCDDERCRAGAIGIGEHRTGLGWIGLDDEWRPIPCPRCKGHPIGYQPEIHDSAEREPSADARAAIENQTD